MKTITANEVRRFLLGYYASQLAARGLHVESVPDQFDLLTEGIVDSMGILDMVSAVEREIGFELDMQGLDAQQMTILGPFCSYVEKASAARRAPIT
jgi:acyl carrier protein